MAASVPNPGPANEILDSNTQETEFWDDSIALRGPTRLAEPISPLCSSCQSLLFRPTCDPGTQEGSLTEPRFVVHRSVPSTSRSAINGCIICKLVLATRATIKQYTASAAQLDSFSLALCWVQEPLNRFDRIDVFPINHRGFRLCTHGYHNGIQLVLEHATSAEQAIKHPSPLNTGSQLCGATVVRWFDGCVTHHPRCRESRTGTGWLPTRLIDVGTAGTAQTPMLVLTSDLETRNDIGYTTLSHRWAADRVPKLTSSNIDSLKQHIPLESLPDNFVDAIRATRALGFRYLWIDSLCIVQDSFVDWQAESSEMGNVYENCVCNIAATGSSDQGGGLFQERDTHWVTPNRIRIQYQGHDKVYSASLIDLWGKWVSRSNLNRRGWVFQERMLSPRTIHSASQLFWECRMLRACETYPEGMPSSQEYYEEPEGNELPISFKNWREECNSKIAWTRMVENFGRYAITKSHDRLIAIAGIAKSLQLILRDEYLAGLWKSDIPYNLSWGLINVKGEVKRPDEYRCPSWSWAALDYTSASIENQLVDEERRIRSLITVVQSFTEPLPGSDEYDLLQGGHLVLTGRIGRIFSVFGDQGDEGEWIDDHYSFELSLDLGLNSVDDESLYCFPLCIRALYLAGWPRIVDCLLLRKLEGDSNEYRRVGLLQVSLDLEDVLPEEIRWIVEYAYSTPCWTDLDRVTIY